MSVTTIAVPAPSSASTLNVAELLAGIERRDPSAWAEIIRRYGRLVLVKARSFRLQEADVLDAVQTTWLRLAERSGTVRDPERLGGWLATTVSRECLRILRGTRDVGRVANMASDEPDSATGPEQQAVEAGTAVILRAVVAQLPPLRRDLVKALFEDDPSPYAELAGRFGMSVGSIGPTRARSLRQLRGLLEERDLAASA